MLLDEPFAALDASLRQRLRDEVRSILRAAEATAVLVTHDQEEALSIADTVAVMMGGRILQVGPPEEVYHRPVSLEAARFLGDGQLIACRVEGDRASCALGTVTCEGGDGQALLLVRPEDLAVTPRHGEASELLAGRVARRHFFGHDLIDEVEVAGGEVFRVRVLASECVDVGDPVTVELRPGTYRAFSEPRPG